MGAARSEYDPLHVKRPTKMRFVDFANAMRMTHDDALNYLIDSILEPGEDALLAGRRIRLGIEEPGDKPLGNRKATPVLEAAFSA